MYRISDEEVDFILKDIKAQGIQIEDLQYNLLDHICCIIENEMPEHENFYNFYQKIIPSFFNTNLKEIQTATRQVLRFKHYVFVQNILKFSGLVAVLFILLGIISRVFEWGASNLFISIGAWLFALLFMPLMIVLKFKDEDSLRDKWILSFGFFLAILASLGIGFKLMAFPYANILIQGSSVLFLGVYLPLYYILRAKKAELKFNTTIHAVLMMVFGGMLFSLSHSGEKNTFQEDLKLSQEHLEQSFNQIHSLNESMYSDITPQENLLIYKKGSDLLLTKISKIKDNIRQNISRNPYDLLVESQITEEISKYNHFASKFLPSKMYIILYPKDYERASLQTILLKLTQIQLQISLNENYFLGLQKK